MGTSFGIRMLRAFGLALGWALAQGALAQGNSPAVSVTIDTPVTGIAGTAPASIGLTATASINRDNWQILRVEYYSGATLIGSATSSPYSVTWTNVPAGSYTLTARAIATNPGQAKQDPAKPNMPTWEGTSTPVAIRVNAAPSVALTAPPTGLAGTAPATITVSANAADSDGSVAKVDFYANGTPIGTATGAPYSISWTNVPAGAYSVTAVAIDNNGASATSAAVAIRVNAPPTAALTAPASGALYNAPATIALSADASDPDGMVAKVEFYAGSNLIGAATAAPFGVTWADVAPGTYSVTAVATDDRGAATSSAPVSVIVNALPTVALSSPGTGTVVHAPGRIAVLASAADADGSVAKVEFYAGTTLIGTVVAAPYSLTWADVPAGTYSLTAVATDERGASRVSAPVSVTVNALPQVSITSPASGQTYSTPASIAITASASDADGNIQRVELYANGALVATLTAAPYSFTWTGAEAGNYSLAAKAVDNSDGEVLSAAVSVTVTAVKALYFIHADHLATPRVIADENQRTVWRWDQAEPFGATPPNEDPDGDSIAFDFPMRFPGQYFDRETNLAYNYFRDYDPAIGRYVESDPIGLRGGLNTFAYVYSNPLSLVDPSGLQIAVPVTPPAPGTTNANANANIARALTNLINRMSQAINNVCSSADYAKCVKDCRIKADFENERCYQQFKNDPWGYEQCAAGVLARLEICVIDCAAKYGF